MIHYKYEPLSTTGFRLRREARDKQGQAAKSGPQVLGPRKIVINQGIKVSSTFSAESTVPESKGSGEASVGDFVRSVGDRSENTPIGASSTSDGPMEVRIRPSRVNCDKSAVRGH
jgi:hypothetical protein